MLHLSIFLILNSTSSLKQCLAVPIWNIFIEIHYIHKIFEIGHTISIKRKILHFPFRNQNDNQRKQSIIYDVSTEGGYIFHKEQS